jgi:hypothetical protein
MGFGWPCFGLFLFPKNVENQTEKDAKKNAGCQREVEAEAAALDPDIPGKTAEV